MTGSSPNPSSQPPPQPQNQQQASLPIPRLDNAARQAEALSTFGRFDCAGLSTVLREDNTLVVGGFVQSAADRDRLMAALQAIPGMGSVEQRVAIHPPPVCNGLQVVGGIAAAGFRLDTNRADRVYRIGRDRLSFRITPARRGVIKVAVINRDGTVTQPEAWSRMAATPGQALRFGETEGGVPLEPPSGQMLLIAIVSNAPLFARPRPEEEPAETFFAALRDALSRAPDAQTAFAVIDTVQ